MVLYSLLCGISDVLLSRLQRVHNNAARLIARSRSREHITPLLISLHWLPVRARIEYKVLLLVYKALHGLAPDYLCQLLKMYQPSRCLRSAKKDLLVEPRAKLSTVGDRAFSVFAPRQWNKVPPVIRHSESLPKFKAALKTHLFRTVYQH